jgi:hypothetical protein
MRQLHEEYIIILKLLHFRHTIPDVQVKTRRSTYGFRTVYITTVASELIYQAFISNILPSISFSSYWQYCYFIRFPLKSLSKFIIRYTFSHL